MRDAFASEITKLAVEDPRVVLLSGDIGNRLFDGFKAQASDRFLNCGVAEANMVSMAAGMAMCGLRPVTYTITPFMTTRCLEQIRVDVCYQNQPVIIVGTGAGLSYANCGATHHSCEDIAFLRSLPGMTVVCPGDPLEVRLAIRAALAHRGPVYLRIGKKGEPLVHRTVPDFRIGKAITVREGQDIALVSTGNTLPMAMAAAERLAQDGIAAQVLSFHTVKPLDQEALEQVFFERAVVVTIEEHSRLGGLGGSVAEWLVDHPDAKRAARLIRIGTADAFLHEAGEQAHARMLYGLTPERIALGAAQAFRSERPVVHLARAGGKK